jgi:hypothetical protein
MPIHVLKVVVEKAETGEVKYDFSKVFAWTDEYVKGKDYALLVTDENEIILEPRKSTRPLDFAYVNIKDVKALQTLIKELFNRYQLEPIEIKSLGWDIEKPPWIKVPVE